MSASVPRIGVTCCIDHLVRPTGRVDQRLRLNMWYIDAVLAAGGLPVPLAHTLDPVLIGRQVDGLDGLLVSGGPDVPASLYGEQPHPKSVPVCDRRAGHDFAVFRESDKRRLPIFGICLGCQIINVARGGSLIQHLDDVPRTPPIHHSDGLDYIRHTVRVKAGSLLHRIVPKDVIEVSTSHHQAIERIGSGLTPTAWAPDGVIEALEDPACPFFLAVQWHPEVVAHLEDHAALFRAFVKAAENH
jgi:putative glutamine amidotransferase